MKISIFLALLFIVDGFLIIITKENFVAYYGSLAKNGMQYVIGIPEIIFGIYILYLRTKHER